MISKEYIAGLFDGEGHVSITVTARKGSFDPKLSVNITNTHLPVLELIKEQYGGSFYVQKKVKEHHLQVYRLTFSVPQSKLFLSDMLPYLVIKKRQAEIALEFTSTIYRRGRKQVSTAEKELRESLMQNLFIEKRQEWIQNRQLMEQETYVP